MATDIEVYRDGDWEALGYKSFELEYGTGEVLLAPKLTVETHGEEDIDINQDIRITIDGTERFEGTTRTGGKLNADGDQKVVGRHPAYALFSESISISETDEDVESILQLALNLSDSSGWTLDYRGSSVTVSEFDAEDRTIKQIYRDMMDATGQIWRVRPTSKTIVVEPKGDRGTWESLSTDDGIDIRSYDDGDVETVRNDVKVTGTADEKVTGTADDQDSIDAYGRRSYSYNVEWLSDESEADDLADALLQPEPEVESSVLVPAQVGDVDESLVNYVINIEDDSKGIDAEDLLIERQVIQQRRAVLDAGEGTASSTAEYNRKQQSREDSFEGDNLDKIADGDTFGRVFQDALEDGYHTLSAAVGDLDNIEDGGTYARVNEGNVDSDNYVLLATSTGDLDDIDDGSDYGRVNTTALDAGEIILAEAVGNLDDIEDGEDFGKVDITNLTPGGAVFAKGVELEDGRELDELTTEDAAKSDATVIDGGEILTDSITAGEIAAWTITSDEIDAGTITADEIASDTLTADEIDTLDLETGELTISSSSTDSAWEFSVEDVGSTDVLAFIATGLDEAVIGTSADPVDSMVVDEVAPSSDDIGSVGSDLSSYQEMWAYNFYDADDGTPINDGGDVLAGLSNGHGPPEHCKAKDDETGETRGFSINKMSREVWEVCREQQRVIEDLEARLSDLEEA
ncbi:MAG: hypothetical protein ACOCSF_06585 [Halanaeroarchaeum sp.]